LYPTSCLVAFARAERRVTHSDEHACVNETQHKRILPHDVRQPREDVRRTIQRDFKRVSLNFPRQRVVFGGSPETGAALYVFAVTSSWEQHGERRGGSGTMHYGSQKIRDPDMRARHVPRQASSPDCDTCVFYVRTCVKRRWLARVIPTTGVHGDDRNTEEPTHNGLITMRLTRWVSSSQQSG
ncbi:hypothetical protein ALC53_14068, partial [Atta colombica]